VGYGIVLSSTLGLSIATGVAILRHRLYDIDLIINRTLVYGALSVLLGLAYFVGVTATQAVFQAITGEERLPQLAVVISTLVIAALIAALFSPLRRRIQSIIDRASTAINTTRERPWMTSPPGFEPRRTSTR
jgi:hypothetical protein